MAKNGKLFEQKIKAIQDTAHKEMPNQTQVNVKMLDTNNCKRELDVLVDDLVFECKDYRAGISEIDAAIGKYKDLPQVKTVSVVASKGFTKDAKKKAVNNNINLLELQKADDKVVADNRQLTCVPSEEYDFRFEVKVQVTNTTFELPKIDNTCFYDCRGNVIDASNVYDALITIAQNLTIEDNFRQTIATDYAKNKRPKIDVNITNLNAEIFNLYVKYQAEEELLLKVKSFDLFLKISFEEQDYKISTKEQLVESSSNEVLAEVVQYHLEGQMPILAIEANGHSEMFAIDEQDNTRQIKSIKI